MFASRHINRFLVRNMSTFKTQLFINGAWVDPVRGGKFVTYNPATDTPITEVANGTAEDIDKAVAAAKACLYSEHWGYKSTGTQRAVILRRLGEIITNRKDELARLVRFSAISCYSLAHSFFCRILWIKASPSERHWLIWVTLSPLVAISLIWLRSRTLTKMKSLRTELREP